MYKKSPNAGQLDIFTSPKSLYSGNSLKMYEDQKAWHNQFRQQVTMRIDEDIFRPLYCENNGSPNTSIRILVAMMVLKEAEGFSDQKIFEECRFNSLVRSALGLYNINDPIPTESTYYLFRKHIVEYAEKTNENLLDTVFAQIAKSQCFEFEISGKRVRMDSKLLGGNIAWLSRYELIHETLRLFYNQVNHSDVLDKTTKKRLDELLHLEGNKVVYTCSGEEVKNRLHELGLLIYKVLRLFPSSAGTYYHTLQKVFDEQYKVDEHKVVIPRDKKEISAKSIQSPHDTDCTYRDKGDQQVKGYSINITESCDDDNALNLIGNVDVKKASTSDVDFLQNGIEKAQEIFNDKTKYVHADGAYHSPDNQQYCKKEDVNLYLHAIQGAKGRYQFSYSDNGELIIFDTITNEIVNSVKVICKNDITKWRITITTGYRYFTEKDIDVYMLRKQIAETPIEILQKRNNVEATIFQLGYHYSNAKSRYRGEIKHQMWANIRCLWVNFVRILKYIKKICQKTICFVKNKSKSLVFELYFEIKSFLKNILPNNLSSSENIRFSGN